MSQSKQVEVGIMQARASHNGIIIAGTTLNLTTYSSLWMYNKYI